MNIETIKTVNEIQYQFAQIDEIMNDLNKDNIIYLKFYNINDNLNGFEISGCLFDLDKKVRNLLREYFKESKQQLQSLLTNELEQTNE
jgi:hypothetical protein